ncbi:FadR/GntR family transcriptional regulator [Deinococcus radiomollis]|uniref:FadR/GntR family transcriptional regulator n=1 Tax=Deinococcus radiomollis TaxID=468916 RepID=UPI0038916C29
MFQPATTVRKVDHVLNSLRQAIRSGQLAAGERLPPERELAASFGVGRSSVREALSVLQMGGLLEVRHGQGTYVLELDVLGPELTGTAFGAATPGDQFDFLALTEARYAFELGVARLAAERRATQGLSEMHRAVQALQTAGDTADEARFEAANLAFHLALAQATGNAALCNLARSLHAPLASHGARRVRRAFYGVMPARMPLAVPLHAAIAQAVEAGQPEAAMRAVMAHYANVAAPMLEEGQDGET